MQNKIINIPEEQIISFIDYAILRRREAIDKNNTKGLIHWNAEILKGMELIGGLDGK